VTRPYQKGRTLRVACEGKKARNFRQKIRAIFLLNFAEKLFYALAVAEQTETLDLPVEANP
jgi:hypothetical protein